MRSIPLSELDVGHKIALNVKDDYERVLISAGTVIKNRSIINRLRELNIYAVYIEDDWSADIFLEPVVDEKTANATVDALANMDIEGVSRCAAMIVDALIASALMGDDMQSLKTYDEYTFMHSVHVAINSATLAIGLGYSYERIKNITTGALLHDVGKQMIPIEIINKKGALTEEEMAIVKKHPEDGYLILCQNIDTTSATREIAHQHHENWDGSGYPRGLAGERIYELANAVHLCDVWDALISKRSYKEAFSISDTLELIRKGRGTQFKPELVDAFFKYVPIYSKGSKVLLNTGQEALVVENHRLDMLHPTVLLRDKTKLDLREEGLVIIS